MSDDKNKEKRSKEPQRTGSVQSADRELSAWLHDLWAKGNTPNRIEVRQMSGKHMATRGESVFHEDPKANDKYDVERCNELANRIIAAAQNDCDCTERKQYYMIDVIDFNRRAEPLVRRIGPFQPKRHYLVKRDEDLDLDSESDEELSDKRISLEYTKEQNAQVRFDKNRYDQVMGGMMGMQAQYIEKLQGWLDKLMNNQMLFFERVQLAEDRRAEREVALEMSKLKAEFLRDGRRIGRNLLLGLFGPEAVEEAQNGNALPPAGGGGRITQGIKSHLRRIENSYERLQLDGFLADCREAGIDIPLFGDWEEIEKDGEKKMRCKTPGIFTPTQVAIMIGVNDGSLPADALDAIVPGFKGKHEITIEQMMKAQPIIPEGIGMALVNIKTARERRRAQAAAQATQTQEREEHAAADATDDAPAA